MRSAVLVTLGPPVGRWYLAGPRFDLAFQPCSKRPGSSMYIATLVESGAGRRRGRAPGTKATREGNNNHPSNRGLSHRRRRPMAGEKNGALTGDGWWSWKFVRCQVGLRTWISLVLTSVCQNKITKPCSWLLRQGSWSCIRIPTRFEGSLRQIPRNMSLEQQKCGECPKSFTFRSQLWTKLPLWWNWRGCTKQISKLPPCSD